MVLLQQEWNDGIPFIEPYIPLIKQQPLMHLESRMILWLVVNNFEQGYKLLCCR